MKDGIVIFNDYDRCLTCNTRGSIELYDRYDNPLRYSLMISNLASISKVIDTKQLSHFKCKKCGAEFNIYWVNGLPIPLVYQYELDDFLIVYNK